MKAIQLPALSAEQLRELKELYQTTRDVPLRSRAKMILIAEEKGLTIGAIVRENEETVRHWMKRYIAEGGERVEGYAPSWGNAQDD